jgi:hypothetical protein
VVRVATNASGGTNAGDGAIDTAFDSTHGAGGGGGGKGGAGTSSAGRSGNGGTYGGGAAGASGSGTNVSTAGTAGAGILVFTYTPAATTPTLAWFSRPEPSRNLVSVLDASPALPSVAARPFLGVPWLTFLIAFLARRA